LRTTLARYLRTTPREPVFRYGPQGKPELAGGAIRFSLSHSHDLVLWAISRARQLGVDVERVRPGVDQDVAREFFSRPRRRSLQALPQPERRRAFFRGWTRMEAYTKARGYGLGLGLDALEAFVDRCNPVHAQKPGAGGQDEYWWIYDFSPRRGYVAALAVPGRRCRLRYWTWRAHDLDNGRQCHPSQVQP
jgi:4'-phosphopantetheinyl transferase